MTKHPWFWLFVTTVLLLSLATAGLYMGLSAPLPESALPAGYRANLRNGEIMYVAGGCIACHRGVGPHVQSPSGGREMRIAGGVLHPPNITPDKATGIGNWRAIDFLNAMKRGLGPGGKHYLPAFPYVSYAWMRTRDILDLYHYLMRLPPVRNRTPEDAFTLSRFGAAFWKWLAVTTRAFRPLPGRSARWNRGAYLVLGPGHCAECHTPRNGIGLSDRSRWLSGGAPPGENVAAPSLRGLIRRKCFPDEAAIRAALRKGAPKGCAGMSKGGMGLVQDALSRLPGEDLAAIAAYLAGLE